MDDITPSVRTLVRRHVDPGLAEEVEDPDRTLTSLGLGSLQIVGLLIDIESRFGVRLPAEMIDSATFHSTRTVADAVHALLERGRR